MATQEVRPHGYPSKLLNKFEVAEGTMAVHFEKPPGFDFRPGSQITPGRVWNPSDQF